MSKSFYDCRKSFLPLVASFLSLCVLPVHAADDPTGVLWDTSSQMVMEGMPFAVPPQNQQVCTPQDWTSPPPGRDPSCSHADFQRDANKVTWTMQCAGDMPMTGTGEIIFEGSDSYTGTINATADGMPIKIKLSGKKIGTCESPAR